MSTIGAALIAVTVAITAGCEGPGPPSPSSSASTVPGMSHEPVIRALTLEQRRKILARDFVIVTKTSMLPQPIRAFYRDDRGTEMADPGEEFQVGDVIVKPGLSFKRLVFAGMSKDRCFVHYEHGGMGTGYDLDVFSLSPAPKLLWSAYAWHSAKDLPVLRQAVIDGTFKDK